jgi:hypothetical protein
MTVDAEFMSREAMLTLTENQSIGIPLEAVRCPVNRNMAPLKIIKVKSVGHLR